LHGCVGNKLFHFSCSFLKQLHQQFTYLLFILLLEYGRWVEVSGVRKEQWGQSKGVDGRPWFYWCANAGHMFKKPGFVRSAL